MHVVIAQLIGVAVFFLGVLVLGLWLRQRPTADAARRTSVASHVLFHAGLSVPLVWGLFWPGPKRFDIILGFAPWPAPAEWRALGVALLGAGVYFAGHSNMALMKWGRGMASFVLSKHVVEGSIYQRVRNPMALGWYLMWLGVGCGARSTYLTLYLLLAHIPAHVFYLKFFEERELGLRFGESYAAYRQRIPFLIPRWRRVGE
jgi:protein-S-isoprenylcysteine O-methyltransferase Ste14